MSHSKKNWLAQEVVGRWCSFTSFVPSARLDIQLAGRDPPIHREVVYYFLEPTGSLFDFCEGLFL